MKIERLIIKWFYFYQGREDGKSKHAVKYVGGVDPKG